MMTKQSQPSIQVIVQPGAGGDMSATQNAVQKTLEAIRNAMNNGGAEKIAANAPGATVSLNHVVNGPASGLSLKDMILQRTRKPESFAAPAATTIQAPSPSVQPAPQAAPQPEVKPVEKKKEFKKEEGEFSIETSKLDVDEKELGIKAPVIPAKTDDSTQEKKQVVINEQKLTSKQKQEGDGSFQIETTVMDADEPQSQTQHISAAPTSGAAAKKAAPVKKVEKKKEKKDDSNGFVIETTVATPQLMKALVGDNS
jgi:hypothetical protein